MTRLRSYLARRPWLWPALALATVTLAATAAFWVGGQAGRAVEDRDQGKARHVRLLVGSMWAVVRQDLRDRPELGDEYFRDVLAGRVRVMWEAADRQLSGNILTPWGGAATAGGGSTVGLDAGARDRFWTRVDGLPRDACISVANLFVEDGPALEVRVGDTAPGTVAADRAAVETGCDGGDDDGVGMVFGLEVQA